MNTEISLSKYYIILVSSAGNSDSMLTLLEAAGADVKLAQNGCEALELFRLLPEQFSLILTELDLPEIDGFEIARRVRSLDFPRARWIPIVALADNLSEEDITKCLTVGMNGHIDKSPSFETTKELLVYLNKQPEAQPSPDRYYGIAWNPMLETGHEHIDAQHRAMFELVGRLGEVYTNGGGNKEILEALGFLRRYIVQHFGDEELLMEQCDFPFTAEHKEQHEGFKETVAQLVEDFKRTSAEEMIATLNISVVRWLITHIQKEDRKLADFVKGK